jgi:ribosomal protein L20
MTRTAPALAALAALAFAAPALAGPENDAPAAACGDSSLLYEEAGETWIASEGLAEASDIVGGAYWQYYLMLNDAAGDADHGPDLMQKAAISWMDARTRGRQEQLLEFLSGTFDRRARAFDADAAEVRDEVVAMQHEARELKTAIRRLRTWINVAKRQAPGYTVQGLTLDQMRAELHKAKDELKTVLVDIAAWRQDLAKLEGIVDSLNAGADWADSMLCSIAR